MTENAVVFVPANQLDPHAARCMAYGDEKQYKIVGIIQGDWLALLNLLGQGDVQVVIVSEVEHLDPKRKPRIEVVAYQGDRRGAQRTRIIRRAWAG